MRLRAMRRAAVRRLNSGSFCGLRFRGAAVLAVLMATGWGCERPLRPLETHAVTGRVVLANGKPLTRGRIVLVPLEGLTPPAAGDLGPDGAFTLTTRAQGDGASAGRYKVRIEPATVARGRRGARPPFPLKYIDEDSSGLVVTVQAAAGRLAPITLK